MKQLSLVFLFFSFSSFAQETDSLEAANMAGSALTFSKNADYENSIIYYKKAVALFKSAGVKTKYFEHLADLCQSYIDNADYDRALEVAEDGASLALSEGFLTHEDIFNRKQGIIHNKLSNFSEALSYFEKSTEFRKSTYGESDPRYALSLASEATVYVKTEKATKAQELLTTGLDILNRAGSSARKDKVTLLQNMGSVCHAMSNFADMLKYNQEALDISLEVFEDEQMRIATAYRSVGLAYYHFDEPRKSIQYHQKSLEIQKNLVGDNHPSLITNYVSLSFNYYKTFEPDLSLESGEKAYEIAKYHFGEDHEQTLSGLSCIISAYNLMRKPKEALELVHKLVEGKTRRYGEDNNQVASAYLQLGIAYKWNGEVKKGLPYYLKAMEIRERIWDFHSNLADGYSTLSLAYYYAGEYDLALEHANLALHKNNPIVEKVAGVEWPDLNGYMAFSTHWKAAEIKMFVLYKLAAIKPDSSAYYYEAILKGAKFWESLLEDRQQKLILTGDKFWYASNSHLAFEVGLEAANHLYKKTGDSGYQRELYYFNERSKANMLLAQTVGKKAKSFDGIPDSLLLKEKSILQSIELAKNEYATRLSDPDSKEAQIMSIRNKLLEVEEEYLALKRRFKEDYPRYHELKHANALAKIEDVQYYLSNQPTATAILEYFVAGAYVYVSVIAKDSVRTFQTSFDKSYPMSKKVSNFRNSIINIEDSAFYQHANHLHALLIQPVQEVLQDKQVKSLIIVTDGELGYVPFEILTDSVQDRQYLMEDFDIRYANSATLLLKNNEQNAGNELISFAPDFQEDNVLASADVVRSGMAKLPGAFDEVNALSSILENTPFVSGEATETNFRDNSASYGLIHLATHAIVDEKTPESARLIFSNANDTINDGYLYPHEIYNLRLNAQLVTLSACNTGFGKIRKGEGVMSLSRAFAYAGVPATVVSLWPASDKSTPELMKYFYQNLKDGQAKDLALGNARRAYLKNATGKSKHPFYWGGFVLIGDNQPLKSATHPLIWLLPFTLLAVVIFAVYRKVN